MKQTTLENKEYESLQLSRDGHTLIAQWDNRKIGHCVFTTAAFSLFWALWTGVTTYATYTIFTMDEPKLLAGLWLIGGYAGVIAIPAVWIKRYTTERIEIDNQVYRHFFPNLRWWFPKSWDVGSITKITFGYHEDDSISTLIVWRRGTGDMIAYWAPDDFRCKLFEEIRTHLNVIGTRVPVIQINVADRSD